MDDCSAGICSVYCPRWCVTTTSPPPPPNVGHSSNAWPVVIAVVWLLLVCAVILAICYCLHRSKTRRSRNSTNDPEAVPDEWHSSAAHGLENVTINSIALFQYRKSEKLVEGTECSVCLSEFEDGESLRLMPTCCHAFHPPCIDTWLKSNQSCPLCRADPFAPISHNSQASVARNVPSVQVVVVEDCSQVMDVISPQRNVLDAEQSDGIGSLEDGVSRGYSAATIYSNLHVRA